MGRQRYEAATLDSRLHSGHLCSFSCHNQLCCCVRYNAAIPKAAKLNYKRQPANATSAEAVQGTRSKAAPLQSDRMVKKVHFLLCHLHICLFN